ncbi:aminotransferase [Candidatus Koribacter versatilis Ellin345]|uniref:Aminotransferase n=1 Tax=Koribacter versatilis (strain Ellin345) TaxID=204669 RepID=Q1IRG6_KORVE|nr:aspartate aminotransferase family protein [Candidatus Koribacter versatilis]ABF40534.1 aminotransferase [Candidatus Koribacter versatilis Ellin345]
MSDTIRKYQEYVITSFVKAVQPVVIESASGAIIKDISGREFIDCFAGISVVNAGHCNPKINAAAKAQIDKLVHCGSYIYHSQPTAQLAEKMAKITPGRLKKSFFANSGAEAIEGAMKVARLFTGKHEIISLQQSFHGRTWGTLSITGNQGRKKRGGPYAPGIAFAPAPYAFRSPWPNEPEKFASYCAKQVEETIRYSTSGDVAAFIAEPVMGEGGIIVPPQNYFREVKEVLDRHGILFIADEVQSGFGRTGKMFAIEHYDVEPDILVTAKGIANGYPIAAFTTRDEIAAAFKPGDHLSTFGGNPICCAAALANIEFFEEEKLCDQSTEKGQHALTRLRALQGRQSGIGEVRGLGLMIGVELVKDDHLTPAAAEAEAVRDTCFKAGVLIGVGGTNANVLRLQPPLVITYEQLNTALDVLEGAITEVVGRTAAVAGKA